MSAKNEFKDELRILNIRFLEVFEALKENGLFDTQIEFADNVGVESRVISAIRATAKGETGTFLHAEHVYRTLLAYPIINERYIFRGEEPKIFSEGFPIAQSEDQTPNGLEQRVKELEEMMKKLNNR